MKCDCGTELDQITIKIDGKFKRFWIHPDLIQDCIFKDHGVKVQVEILDNFLNDKFQEQINSKKPLKEEIKEKAEESNMDKIKKRVSEGDISIYEYNEIKKLLDNHL